MKHPLWLLVIVGIFALLLPGWPWIIVGVFCSGFAIGFFGGARSRRPRPVPNVRREQPTEPPPIRFVRATDLQEDLFTFQWRNNNGAISRRNDAPPLAPADLVSEPAAKQTKRWLRRLPQTGTEAGGD
jgi:hypothetical protein